MLIPECQEGSANGKLAAKSSLRCAAGTVRNSDSQQIIADETPERILAEPAPVEMRCAGQRTARNFPAVRFLSCRRPEDRPPDFG